MKIYLALLFGLILSSVSQAAPTDSYAMVDDKDGYVNLRDCESLQSNIIKRLPNGTLLSANCVDYTNNPDFCVIRTDNSVFGYVYKDRLSFLNQDPNFVSIPISPNTASQSNPLAAQYENSQYNIRAQVTLEPFMVVAENFKQGTPDSDCPFYYAQTCSYGLEGFSPQLSTSELYYKLSNIRVQFGDDTITVPEADLQGIFISPYAVDNNEVFKNTKIYYNPIAKHLYLVSLRSYGAGVYSVVYDIDSQGQVTRHTWIEVI